MVAGMLRDLGVDMGRPDEMITAEMFDLPVDDQPGGYHENVRFLRLDKAILARLGGDHYWVPDLPTGWAATTALVEERRLAAELVAGLADRAPWGFKDPRAMLVLELWLDIIPRLRVVLCLRNPLEVAQSIATRGRTEVDDALQWWGRCYNACVPRLPRDAVVVAHERVLDDPRRELQRIVAMLGQDVDSRRLDTAASRVDERLHRQRVPYDPSRLPAGVRDAYERLHERATSPSFLDVG